MTEIACRVARLLAVVVALLIGCFALTSASTLPSDPTAGQASHGISYVYDETEQVPWQAQHSSASSAPTQGRVLTFFKRMDQRPSSDAVSGGAAEEAGSGGTQLFRAVEDPEAADLANTGQYGPSPTGSEYKGFFETQAQAERFAGSMNAQGYAYNTITSGVVPNDLMSELPFTDLVGNEAGRAYLVPNESLPRIFNVRIH